jgi:hypothetical protein
LALRATGSTGASVPLQIIAGWRTADKKYPPIVTVARAGSGVESLEGAFLGA